MLTCPKAHKALVRDICLQSYLSLDSDATVILQPPPPSPRHGVGCCICWWVDWLVCSLTSLLVECVVVGWYIVRLLVGCLVASWFVGLLVVWLVECIYTPWCVLWCGLHGVRYGECGFAGMCSHCKGGARGSLELMCFF